MEHEPAQPGGGRKGAISLAYDGADPSHLELVVPKLGELGLRATFFLPSVELLERARDWMAAHYDGHEMGSHSLFGYTDERGNLPNWTMDMVESDLRMSRKLLTELFPRQTDFPFAYPGDEATCVGYPYDPKPTPYEDVVKRLFRVARRAVGALNPMEGLDMSRIASIDAAGMSYQELVDVATQAMDQRAWAVFAFGPIGSGDPGTDLSHHSAFLSWLKDHEAEAMLAPVWEQAMRIVAPSEMVFIRRDD